MKALFLHVEATKDDGYIQIRFDGAYRRKSGRASIGVSFELAFLNGSSRPLMDLGIEISSENSYEPELTAASWAVHECIHLYSQLCIGTFPPTIDRIS